MAKILFISKPNSEDIGSYCIISAELDIFRFCFVVFVIFFFDTERSRAFRFMKKKKSINS